MQADILELVNEYFGTSYELEQPWHELFAGGAEEQSGALLQRALSHEGAVALSPGAQGAAGARMGAGAAALLGELLSDSEEDGSYAGEDGDSGSASTQMQDKWWSWLSASNVELHL